jgi:NAD(P)-dependent dehydrogenase (short-subunit alcohol dehydrogenase family)
MVLQDKVVVITGGGSGIGAALARAFDHARAIVVVADLRGSETVAKSLNQKRAKQFSNSFTCDVTNRQQVQRMIQQVKQEHGRIDIYCSNAGIILDPENLHDDFVSKYADDKWSRILQVNVQSHVIAARELIPDWEKGIGDGCFVVTASAAGLLTMIGNFSYGVSKAAAVSFAEHVAIAHPKVQVHCLCPQAVDTPFTPQIKTSANSAMTDGVVSAELVAACTLKAISDGDFWILPHPQVQKYAERKALDHKRWLNGMKSLRNKLMNENTMSKL